MNTQLKEIAKVWPDIQPIFSVPHNKKGYDKLVNFLDSLIDEVGDNENHPSASLMETIGSLIEAYESQVEHGLKQSDLTEIGSQGVVSEILSGKRKLNVRQIKMLGKRFKVSPAAFI